MSTLQQEFHSDGGVLLVEGTEHYPTHIPESWVGFVHLTRPVPGFFNLDDFLKTNWLWNKKTCRGLYTFSEHTKQYLEEKGVTAPINRLYHPTCFDGGMFDPALFLQRPQVAHLGSWLRELDKFFRIDIPLPRVLPWSFGDQIVREQEQRWPGRVNYLGRLNNQQYDDLTSRSAVFLCLTDMAACNSVCECIARRVPLVINRLPAAEEYLGVEYPLFYTNLSHAETLLSDARRLLAGHEYLAANPHLGERLRMSSFLQAFADSPIYRSLRPVKM